jgi:hypothetical protein
MKFRVFLDAMILAITGALPRESLAENLAKRIRTRPWKFSLSSVWPQTNPDSPIN